jgi:gluconate kinase
MTRRKSSRFLTKPLFKKHFENTSLSRAYTVSFNIEKMGHGPPLKKDKPAYCITWSSRKQSSAPKNLQKKASSQAPLLEMRTFVISKPPVFRHCTALFKKMKDFLRKYLTMEFFPYILVMIEETQRHKKRSW